MATLTPGGRLVQISAQILTLLATDLGTTDLTSRVFWGRYAVPPTIPFLAIDLDGVDTDEAGPSLGLFGRIATFHFQGWYPNTVAAPAGGYVWSVSMANEVFGKLENAHRDAGGGLTGTAYQIRNLYFTRFETHTTEIESHTYAYWTAKLVIVYATERGI